MIGAILFSLFWSYRLAHSFLRPIHVLKDSAVAFGDGRLDRDVPVSSDDEIGELARAFNAMAAKLRAYRQAATEKMLLTQRTMEATLTSVPDPVFIVSGAGAHELRNPAAEAPRAVARFCVRVSFRAGGGAPARARHRPPLPAHGLRAHGHAPGRP